MTETFTFPVITETSGESEFIVASAKFGDGYQQDVSKGINNEEQKWRVTFTGDEAEAQAVVNFLRDHKGSTSFYWTPPLGSQGYYKVKRYSVSQPHPPRFRVSMEFEQHFAPGEE